MANGDDVALRGKELREGAEAARSRAQTLLARYHDLSRAFAATEERVAETMDRMAAQQPARARRCRAHSQQARKQAARWRQRTGQSG